MPMTFATPSPDRVHPSTRSPTAHHRAYRPYHHRTTTVAGTYGSGPPAPRWGAALVLTAPPAAPPPPPPRTRPAPPATGGEAAHGHPGHRRRGRSRLESSARPNCGGSCERQHNRECGRHRAAGYQRVVQRYPPAPAPPRQQACRNHHEHKADDDGRGHDVDGPARRDPAGRGERRHAPPDGGVPGRHDDDRGSDRPGDVPGDPGRNDSAVVPTAEFGRRGGLDDAPEAHPDHLQSHAP